MHPPHSPLKPPFGRGPSAGQDNGLRPVGPREGRYFPRIMSKTVLLLPKFAVVETWPWPFSRFRVLRPGQDRSDHEGCSVLSLIQGKQIQEVVPEVPVGGFA